jgi:hypothetical protein
MIWSLFGGIGAFAGWRRKSAAQLVFVTEKRQPPHVILSEAKNLSHIEILRFAQDDKIGFRNRN